ncbi:MAG: GAF domain-containing protein [Anaerolineae bacterium]|nr:GAF domain-containing protein [Anaerolineae bacterium]
MTTPAPESPVTEQEALGALHVLHLLQNQVRVGRVDHDFLQKQLDKLARLMQRIEQTLKARKSAGRFETLYNVSRMLGTSLDRQTVLEQVMDAVIQLTGAERGFLMLRDDDGELQMRVARNIDQQTLSSDQFRYSRTIANYVIDRGEAVLTTNAVEDPRFSGNASIVSQSLRSIMVAPLRARGQVIGIAYVENRVVAGLFNPEDLTTLETLAAQASIAIDNALLFSVTDQALARRLEELSLLRRIDLRLSEKLDPDMTIQYTLEAACDLTKASSGHLGLLQGDPPRVVNQHYYQKGEGGRTRQAVFLDDVYPRVWEVIHSGRPITFDTGLYGLHTVLILPVLRERSVIGVLVLRREDGSPFNTESQDLVERVISRAAIAIENARLYSAVQSADKAKSEFVGIVAHDLKAPMTGIQGYADLLLMNPENLTERQQVFIRRISDTVKRMEILVSDLADISRIEGGQFFMDQTRVRVLAIVEATRDFMMPQMQARQHTYVEKIAPELPDMYVDYYRLMQILTNLLTNACKYTPEGGTITLHAALVEQRIRFEVEDTGIGLSKKDLALLGTKFWRAEDDFTRSQPGTGLGFAITSGLVKQMGSKIDISSEVQKGSKFGFSVPVYVAKDVITQVLPEVPGGDSGPAAG